MVNLRLLLGGARKGFEPQGAQRTRERGQRRKVPFDFAQGRLSTPFGLRLTALAMAG